MVPAVRTADAAELPFLAEIERAADLVFHAVGIVFPPGTVIDTVEDASQVLVMGEPPIAFAYCSRLDDHLHLHQIAVHPQHARRGLGTVLMEAVVERAGSLGVTLTTFAHVPWNRPWYARLGFAEMVSPGPELADVVKAERDAGLDDLGERLVMYRPPRIGT
ncbi:GNAT superfamily N-acetyltransferase [Kibdelosporangium banguiense]|uniref:GNAT superfamily N-acetyltransferase n=1 Tax=Kibdelosporangium banguiense TaxID=1365924 RepID=A0ABS4U2T4_9PSEU|nr:GNAT family N-acetyltransferase [Kibdelosporangium banguiense]MBP2330974.1 GNAT superfamily N-acetyltransferase [Kibdelosporangium banguiense]